MVENDGGDQMMEGTEEFDNGVITKNNQDGNTILEIEEIDVTGSSTITFEEKENAIGKEMKKCFMKNHQFTAPNLPLSEMYESCLDCHFLPEKKMKLLVEYVTNILSQEDNVQLVSTPVIVCGDIHGQYYDLQQLFTTGGEMRTTDNNYIFMGDYVDRGYFSLETLTQLLLLKALYPRRIMLLRGNHESRQTTQVYGFYDECLQKYGNSSIWRLCCNLFDYMTISALIDNKILCVHGGLSPEIRWIDQMQLIERHQEIPHHGAFCDLMWSDPETQVNTWYSSPRGAGWLFGSNVVDEFIYSNNIQLICRAHQLVNDGFKFMFDKKLVTVWSAPNYCYRCGNVAAILEFPKDLSEEPEAKLFHAVPQNQRRVGREININFFM
ncbi:hypothetical protein SNEBB_010948 [Seison nebaliae]|nr:hypothetical protein SNEBB_010948 [Seison nebaliae]